MAYEIEMSEYNYINGGIKTIIIPAKDSEISSTLVREKLQKNADVSSLVDKEIQKILEE